MKTAIGAAALAAVLALSAPHLAAAQGAPDVLQQVKDRAEIEDLMWRYNRALDTLNADAYVQAFTPDGAFGKTQGREALHKMIADLKAGEAKGRSLAGMHHVETNERLEFTDRDHARLHYYWMTLFAGASLAEGAKVAAVGNGVDDLVRQDGHWLIKYRNVTPTDD